MEARAFYRRSISDKRRHITSGEDIFNDPRIGRRRSELLTDCVHKGYAILIEHLRNFLEISIVIRQADMLEHSNRDDAIKLLVDLAIIEQTEIDPPPIIQGRRRAFRRWRIEPLIK